MHKKDYKRAQSVMKIHKEKKVYLANGKFYWRKNDAPSDAIKIVKETNNG